MIKILEKLGTLPKTYRVFQNLWFVCAVLHFAGFVVSAMMSNFVAAGICSTMMIVSTVMYFGNKASERHFQKVQEELKSSSSSTPTTTDSSI